MDQINYYKNVEIKLIVTQNVWTDKVFTLYKYASTIVGLVCQVFPS